MAENVNITPDMINNLVNMLKNSNSSSSDNNKEESSNASTSNESRGIFSNFVSASNSNSSSSNTGGLDFETIMKIKSILEIMNKKDDPNSKLLYSLKPYLRKSKQEKLDQYVNILKISQVTNLFNNNSNKKEGDAK